MVYACNHTNDGNEYLQPHRKYITLSEVIHTTDHTLDSNLQNHKENINLFAQVEMKEFIKQLPGGLAYKLVKGGLNLSMGQRQLISLARAIVRNKKILISDEATASIDPETDRLIRDTIRLNFTDCTVLTISHQLYNVMDSDRILVMQNGSIVEFDRPVVLMQQSDGYLRKMVYCHDPATIENLTNLARK